MNNLKNEYSKITNDLAITEKEINCLEKSDVIKRYNELLDKKDELLYKQKEVFKNMKFYEYNHCNHLWVSDYGDESCIKCGLNTEYDILEYQNDYYHLDYEHKVMHNYLKQAKPCIYLHKGKNTKIKCDASLATAVYNKIKEYYPDIKDDEAVKYLRAALYNMQTKDNYEIRRQSRIKRLKLTNNYNNWNYKI